MADSLLNYKMPYSVSAEQAALGSILINPDCFSVAISQIRSEFFYNPQHKSIFEVMTLLDSKGEKLDPVVIANSLKEKGIFAEQDIRPYLADLAKAVPTSHNIESYCKIIRDKYYLRRLIESSQKTIDDCVDEQGDAEKILALTEQRIYDIRSGKRTGDPEKLSDILTGPVAEHLEELSKSDEKYSGIPTGFSYIDRVISGLNKSDLIIIGARPGMGKTSFAVNIARNVACLKDKKVLFFSLEMSKEQIAEKILATEARINSSKMRTGITDDKEWERISLALEYLHRAQFYIDDTPGITVPEMKAKTRRLGGVDCLVVDYLQLLTSGKRNEGRVQEVSEITRNLKIMAKDLNIPVIVLSQLNRNSAAGREKKDHRPTMSELRESGSIEQDADIIILLYREGYFDTGTGEEKAVDPTSAEAIIAKNRHGGTGTAQLSWNGDYTLFTTRDISTEQ